MHIQNAMVGASAAMLVACGHLTAATLSVPIGEVETIHVSEGTNVLEDVVILDGTLRKTGPGTLVVPVSNVIGLNGEIVAAEGCVLFAGDPVGESAQIPEPTDVLSKAAFWTEADRNVVSGNDGVVRWCDVRETSPGAPSRLYAESQTSFTAELPELTERADGTPYVYFGGLGSGCWMLWKDPSTSSNAWLEVRSAVVAQGPVASQGHVLGSATADDAHPSGFLESTYGDVLYSRMLAPIAMATWYLAPVKTGPT